LNRSNTMENNTDILDRITPEEIEEWLIAKLKAEKLHAISLNCLNYAHRAGVYWAVHTKVNCVHETTLAESLSELRRQQKEPAEMLIRERREQAARLLAEADELEGDAA